MRENDLVQVLVTPPASIDDVRQAFSQMGEIMRGMADMIRATNEEMAALKREVRLLTKVTPAQATAINEAIRMRAAELCESYHAMGCEKPVANAIRRAVRLTTGTNSVRELPRCEYSVALEQVRMWDDYKVMRAIRAKAQNRT